MTALEDILKIVPVDQIAKQLGVDPAEASKAIVEGGATILSGLQRNAQTTDGAQSLEKALGQHAGLGDRVEVDAIDTTDGQKILGHIFGGKEQNVAEELTKQPATAGIDFGKLLPLLAPVVMGLLANRQSQAPAGEQSAGGLGDLIGGLVGGGGNQGGGFDIGGLLGGLLGSRN